MSPEFGPIEFDWEVGYLRVSRRCACGVRSIWWGTELRSMGVVTDKGDEEGCADVLAKLVNVSHECSRA